MNRARKTQKGLPRRVYLKHGAYRFFSAVPIRDPKSGKLKKWHHLAYEYEGRDAIYQPLAKLLGDRKNEEGSMPFVCAEFKASKLKKYGKDTQAQYSQYLDVIAEEFEDFAAAQVTTKEVAGFLRDKFKDKPNTAQKYSALMKKMFKFVISELGLRQDNPIDQLDLSDYETQRREKLPTHDQVKLIREHGMLSKPRKDNGKQVPNKSGPMFQCIIDMTYLCWARAIDVRMLKESQIDGDWIRFKPTKTVKSSGKVVDIFITQQIRAVIDKAREIKRKYEVISPYLFPTQKGTPYTKSGLFSMWDRARERAGITDEVWFKDLRALGATDAAKTGEQKEEIRKRLIHTSSKTSEIYIKEAIPERSELDMVLPW
jgi:integrase